MVLSARIIYIAAVPYLHVFFFRQLLRTQIWPKLVRRRMDNPQCDLNHTQINSAECFRTVEVAFSAEPVQLEHYQIGRE
jgi:hypothetical protein